MSSKSTEFTELLRTADKGDADAAHKLFLLVEDELKVIARKRLSQLPRDVDVSTTALVDEAFVRLVGEEVTEWKSGSRRKFFSYITTRIHNVLIDAARAEQAAKRGGGFHRVEGEDGPWEFPSPDGLVDVQVFLDLQESLDNFAEIAGDDALIFRLRYFLGCTFDEIADILSVSATTAKRGYELARSYLRRELKGYNDDA